VAVDSAGTAYVASSGRVLLLPAGATTATEVFMVPDDGSATDVAADSAGNVYLTDSRNNRVFKIPIGGGRPIELPFAHVLHPQGIAVDTAGTVYVVDSGNHRVMKLVADTPAATDPRFEGLKDPYDVAVDTAGNVYVTDQGNRQVMKFPRHQ
jgi:DNA-binding beta-propeller fold protein YncE